MLTRMNLKQITALACLPAMLSVAPAVDVVLSGGVALKSWEKLRGPNAHDNWWANFVRGATVRIDKLQTETPKAKKIEPESNMISIFDVADNEVIEELRKTDINTLSPYEAMSFLYGLQKRLK